MWVGSSVAVKVIGTVCVPDGDGVLVYVSVAICVGVPVGGGVLLPVSDDVWELLVVLEMVIEPSSIDSEDDVVTLTVMVSERLTVADGDCDPEGDSLTVSVGVVLATGLTDMLGVLESVTVTDDSFVGDFLVGL